MFVKHPSNVVTALWTLLSPSMQSPSQKANGGECAPPSQAEDRRVDQKSSPQWNERQDAIAIISAYGHGKRRSIDAADSRACGLARTCLKVLPPHQRAARPAGSVFM